MKKTLPIVLVFLSGFACLVYQLLWMRQLGLLFGNTAHAAGMTLAVFFAGLAAGSWFWGRKSQGIRNPMSVYAGLELGIAVSALAYFAILAIFYSIYSAVYRSVASASLIFAVKSLLAFVLIFPPSFFMGGTIPVMGQAVIHERSRMGVKAAWLYAVNTLGAAMGALSTGFLFVRLMGFTWTCMTAICITCIVALIAWRLSKEMSQEEVPDDFTGASSTVKKDEARVQAARALPAWVLYAVCFVSGFGFLALEVLWTRLLAQIHTNSVYSFSAVLVIVLVSLALGAAAASGLARLKIRSGTILAFILLLGGISIVLSPFIFMGVTNGFQMLPTSETLFQYLEQLFGKGVLIVGLPAMLLGMVFPFLMKTEEQYSVSPGVSLGRLSAINTFGAITGSLLCAFFFLEHFGLWRTMQLIGAVYLLAGMLLPIGLKRPALILRSLSLLVLILLCTWLSPVKIRVTGWDPNRSRERLLEVWETSDGTVSVVLSETDGCVIKMNSNYRLGSTGAAWREHFQGRIPLLAYPDTRSVFFLGMGTGISAGGALDPRFSKVERVVVCELAPEVVTAAEKYMTGDFVYAGAESVDFTSGLFSDDRVEIVKDDGRHYLMAREESFDMINADLRLWRNTRSSRVHTGSAMILYWADILQISD